MAPACSRLPRAQFYDGKGLEDSETVLQDIAGWKSDPQDHEGDHGQSDNDGLEHVVTDVVNGYSRVELGSERSRQHLCLNGSMILQLRLLSLSRPRRGHIVGPPLATTPSRR